MEILRGLASLAVAWFHLTGGSNSEIVRASGSFGWLGVEAFFVISGFIIPYSLWKSDYRPAHFVRFIARRLVRLEPPYLVSVAVVIILWIASAHAPGFRGSEPTFNVGQIAAHTFYLIPFTNHQWLNPVYWTLFYEFIFYIVIGISYPMIARANIIIVLFYFIVLFLLVAAIADPPWIALLFLIGFAGFRFAAKIDRASTLVVLSVGCALVLAMAGGIKGSVQAAVGLATIAAILLLPARIPASLALLGAVSYSLYLLHVPIGGRIVNLGRRFGEGPLFEGALSLVALAVCLVAAALFYRWVEKPARTASRRIRLDASVPAPSLRLR